MRARATAAEGMIFPPARVSGRAGWAVAVFLVAAVALLAVRLPLVPLLKGPGGSVLSDPDSYMRWRLVQRAMAGEGVRIRWVDDDNAPHGRLNEWTSPTTLLGVVAVRAVETLGGIPRQRALREVGVWFGPAMGVLCVAALGWLGWRGGGWPLAACWMLAWPALGELVRITQPGNTDHHSLHQLLFLCLVGGCVTGRRTSAADGAWVGLAAAGGMWSGASELLPAWLCLVALGCYEVSQSSAGPRPVRFWRWVWVSGMAGTAAAWLFEFWPELFHGRLEFLSGWHVLLWLVGGGLWEFLGSRPRKLLAFLVAVLLALLVLWGSAVAWRGIDCTYLHVSQDPRFQWQQAVTAEFGSFAGGVGGVIRRCWWEFGLLPLAVLGSLWRRASVPARVHWLNFVTIVFFALAVVQVRWAAFCASLLVMVAGLVLCHPTGRRPWLCILLVVVATVPPWVRVVSVGRDCLVIRQQPLLGPHHTTLKLEAVSDCLGTSAARPVVLAPWDQGSVLAGMGKVRVVASGYWSNLDGLMDGYELFITPSKSRFWHLVKQRQIEFFVMRPLDLLAQDIGIAFAVLHGVPPTAQQIQNTVLWRLATDPQTPRVECHQLQRLSPHWKILRLVPPAGSVGQQPSDSVLSGAAAAMTAGDCQDGRTARNRW